MDKLDVNATPQDRGKIRNEEQARNWVESLIVEMLVWRHKCDVIIPDRKNESAILQKKALWTFLTKQGKVTGALKTLHKCGLLGDRAYEELNQKAINTLIPTRVGVK